MNPYADRLTRAEKKLAVLEAKQKRLDANAIPSTFVTGNSGVTALRRAKLDRQLDRTIDLAVAINVTRVRVMILRSAVELYDQGLINAQGRSVGHSKPANKASKRGGDRLFVGVYPAGIVYCDRWREKQGDYLRVAFLPYKTLVLEWQQSVPDELKVQIETNAQAIQACRGEQYQVSACGQTVRLGA